MRRAKAKARDIKQEEDLSLQIIKLEAQCYRIAKERDELTLEFQVRMQKLKDEFSRAQGKLSELGKRLARAQG